MPATIGFMETITTGLYVVRHAPAEDLAADGSDHARRLTRKGRKRFARLVRRLVRGGMQIDLIATSPLVRARETADILADELPTRPRIEVVEALVPGSDWQELVEWTIRQDAARVAWVGHAPCVGRLVAISIGDGSAAVRMQKGAIAAIALDDGPGQPGELEWLATPDFVERR
ncbi:MAG: phosphohistidine phosphatase SixA [Planctomycetia bacterium]|nr:phosphohistidine phosphatase SixA [Planctomycetia bacterium]